MNITEMTLQGLKPGDRFSFYKFPWMRNQTYKVEYVGGGTCKYVNEHSKTIYYCRKLERVVFKRTN